MAFSYLNNCATVSIGNALGFSKSKDRLCSVCDRSVVDFA